MAFRIGWRTLAFAAALVACGAAAAMAWRDGLWGLLTGAVLVALWLTVLNGLAVAQRRPRPAAAVEDLSDAIADRLLLDAAPVPMVALADGHARALNRAARHLFVTDDRVLPVPAGLLDHATSHLRYEGRQWRIDRVILGQGAGRIVAALVDVEQEERAGEARATAEMIQVLGHELLNGLAPIVSLAESGEAVLERGDPDPAMLREILATLARRAEGLQRFTGAYRELARLPPPQRHPQSIPQLAGDMAQLFAARWPDVVLVVNVAAGHDWPFDRDQIDQALWALLQNAAEAATDACDNDARVTLAIDWRDTDLVIAVTDNGAGVAPDDVTRIFRPFHTTKPDGTGIGLSLARHIAHAHGGSLRIVANPDTTFVLSLPG